MREGECLLHDFVNVLSLCRPVSEGPLQDGVWLQVCVLLLHVCLSSSLWVPVCVTTCMRKANCKMLTHPSPPLYMVSHQII